MEHEINSYNSYYYFFTENFLFDNNKIIHNRNIEYKSNVSINLHSILAKTTKISNTLQFIVNIGYDVLDPIKYNDVVKINEAFKASVSSIQIHEYNHDLTCQELCKIRSNIDQVTQSNISSKRAYLMLQDLKI
jgi:hypothetical protein